MPPPPPHLPSLSTLSTLLSNFKSSTSSFRVLSSIPQTTFPLPTPPKSLFILDSSFNPPTIAHLYLALSALRSPSTDLYPSPRRLLLLLSTQNADKAPQPASFEHRLAMMYLLASELRSALSSTEPAGPADVSESPLPGIDIGVTSQPYFHLKSSAIEGSGIYGDGDGSGPTHIHIIGYDTLIRLFDTKYYPPSHSLAVLAPFLARHRLRVHLRPGEWGERERQDEWIGRLGGGEGMLVRLGGRGEWVARMEVVEASEGRGVGVSSSRVRKAVREGEGVEGLVTDGIRGYIEREGLYKE